MRRKRIRLLMMSGRAVAPPVTPWYLSGGIAGANCIGAYQAKGAASYAASKVNLNNPGTNDLSDGAAFPTWAADTGWTFVAASSQYLTIASAIATVVPLSMVCRFNADDANTYYILMSICHYDGQDKFALSIAGHVAGDPIQAVSTENATSKAAVTSTGFTASTPYTAAGIFTNNSSRSAYIDGGSKGNEITLNTPSGLDRTYIGAYALNGGLSSYLKGKIIACCFYSIALSDAQVSALHNAMAAL